MNGKYFVQCEAQMRKEKGAIDHLTAFLYIIPNQRHLF
jgi:hypothetical protein